MNESNKILRNKLLDMEKPNPSHREKYEKEIREMFEKKLTSYRKLGHIVGLIMGLGFAVLFGTLAVILPKEFPLWGRFMWAVGAIFGLAFVGVEGWILKKGTINLKKDNMAMAGLGWGFIVIMATITLLFSGKLPDPVKGVHMLVCVLIFVVMAAVGLLKAIIERSELNTREKLLEIEYRLAELAEKLEGKPGEEVKKQA